MKKLSTPARILYTLSRIASVCCIVALCIVLVAAVLLFGFGNESMIEFSGLELGNLTFELTSFTSEMLRSAFLCEMLPGAVLLAFGWAILRIIQQILAPMKDGQPFDASVSQKLRKLCWITVAGGVISQALAAVAGIMMVKAYDFTALFQNENIAGVNVNIDLDLTFVVLALIWYMLSCVFQYGEELQKQSDETL